MQLDYANVYSSDDQRLVFLSELHASEGMGSRSEHMVQRGVNFVYKHSIPTYGENSNAILTYLTPTQP